VVLLSNMVEGRTHIKVLRRLGVALILSPEFITTPFGVALVLVARYLARKREARARIIASGKWSSIIWLTPGVLAMMLMSNPVPLAQ
jgi:hypothetical protein